MLKLCRNHLIDDGYTLEDGKKIGRKDLEEILFQNQVSSLILH